MKPKVEKALNEQIHAEFFSFYLYLSVAAYFTAHHLDGFAHWMRIQAQEEFGHAMKLFDHLAERGGTVELGPQSRAAHQPADQRHRRPGFGRERPRNNGHDALVRE
jgi:ferritin